MRLKGTGAAAVMAMAVAWSQGVAAQTSDYDSLMSMDNGGLRSELEQRYQAGLSASNDPAISGANDARYLWALETKTQCAIAIGFMKSATRDETSIRKCTDAFAMMSHVPAPRAPAPVPPPPPPAQRPDICDDEIVGIVFFEFDSAGIPSEGGQTLDQVVANIPVCGWTSLGVSGHTDTSGSVAYNLGLSRERADMVAGALEGRGVTASALRVSAEGESRPRVPTPDGTRSPQNRRVEITAN